MLIFSVATLFTVGSRPAWACSCGEPGRLASADTAFVGVVTALNRPSLMGDVDLVFAVESVQKGDPGNEIELTTASQGPACGYPFTEGRRYQVYAIAGTTSSCSGNEDLGFVRDPGMNKQVKLGLIGGTVVLVLGVALFLRRRRQ